LANSAPEIPSSTNVQESSVFQPLRAAPPRALELPRDGLLNVGDAGLVGRLASVNGCDHRLHQTPPRLRSWPIAILGLLLAYVS
jgi:hypothetical protein